MRRCKKTLKSSYWREIEFAQTMNKRYPINQTGKARLIGYPDLFMTLYDHDIIKDYNFFANSRHPSSYRILSIQLSNLIHSLL